MPESVPEILDDRGVAVERMFSAIAPRYDFLNRLLSAGYDRAWRRQAVAATALPREGILLDVCTGTADLALEAARQFPDARIVGVDFSRPMIALGAAKIGGARLTDRVRLEVAQAEALPFADGSFDAVTVAFGLRNLPDRLPGLREMCRVLRPGGRAVILEFTTPPGALLRRAYLWYFHRVSPGSVGWSRATRWPTRTSRPRWRTFPLPRVWRGGCGMSAFMTCRTVSSRAGSWRFMSG